MRIPHSLDPRTKKGNLVLGCAVIVCAFSLVIFSQTTLVAPEARIEIAGEPSRVYVPRINVDAAVEHVGLMKNGFMDIPKAAADVGWFELGYRPGEKGNAVLAGHLDGDGGIPAVFWNLHMLQVGDDVYLEDDQGRTLQFRVTGTATYDYDKSPLEEIFGPSDVSRLNLITCNGPWNESGATYSKRLVVYTELVPSTESVSMRR